MSNSRIVMAGGQISTFPRHENARVMPGSLSLERRGRRGCRVFCTPVASVALVESTRVRNYRYAETIRHSLHDGLRAYLALSPVSGLDSHRHPAKRLAE